MSNRYYCPSREERHAFKSLMKDVRAFCLSNNIDHSRNYDSYYFSIGGVSYRVSNHTVAASNRNGARVYHPGGEVEGTVYITASKTRIIEIYSDLKAGFQLTRRGYRVLDEDGNPIMRIQK